MSSRPGSRAWVEEHHGPTAALVDRIPGGIVDALLSGLTTLGLLALGTVVFVAGYPETYPCSTGLNGTCVRHGTGSGPLMTLGIILLALALVAGLGVILWNRVLRVARTGQSLGKSLTGLQVIDARSGEVPGLGQALLRELISAGVGVISWLWILVDDEDRSLADVAAGTHVIHLDRDDEGALPPSPG